MEFRKRSEVVGNEEVGLTASGQLKTAGFAVVVREVWKSLSPISWIVTAGV
ncbi:hypothetical protein [Halomicrobium urmianum]|uniref:hypothetical protein n=1 Tax=Halomicrobium urmianum TaxID=1586233 RepID=UPI001CDA47C9|nr:hypothetical protein [Halomicrobium urmianum]